MINPDQFGPGENIEQGDIVEDESSQFQTEEDDEEEIIHLNPVPLPTRKTGPNASSKPRNPDQLPNPAAVEAAIRGVGFQPDTSYFPVGYTENGLHNGGYVGFSQTQTQAQQPQQRQFALGAVPGYYPYQQPPQGYYPQHQEPVPFNTFVENMRFGMPTTAGAPVGMNMGYAAPPQFQPSQPQSPSGTGYYPYSPAEPELASDASLLSTFGDMLPNMSADEKLDVATVAALFAANLDKDGRQALKSRVKAAQTEAKVYQAVTANGSRPIRNTGRTTTNLGADPRVVSPTMQPMSKVQSYKPIPPTAGTRPATQGSGRNGSGGGRNGGGGGGNGQGRGQPDPNGAVYPTNPETEYLYGGEFGWTGHIYQALPQSIDELERDFPEIYEKMMLDPKVRQSVQILKLGVLSQGMSLVPRIQDERHPQYMKSRRVYEFCQRNLDRLQRPIMSVLSEMMDAVVYGHTVAEQVYERAKHGPDKGKLVLKALKIKPRHSVAFVVDRFFTVIGLTPLYRYYDTRDFEDGNVRGRTAGGRGRNRNGRSYVNQSTPAQVGYGVNAGYLLTGPLLSRQKFMVFAPFTKDGDPRGQSILRGAYTPWWMKTQAWPEYLRYLAQFASPMLVGYTPDGAQAKGRDASGRPITPEQVMLRALIQAKNGAAMAFPNGSKVEALNVGNGGNTFLEASRMFDEQISMAILLQTLASGEGIHQTRASSKVHKSLLAMLIRWVQQELGNALMNDVLRNLVDINFPGDTADTLTPFVQVGTVEVEDFAGTANAIVALWEKGYLDPTQVDEMDALLGLPRRPAPPQRPAGGGAAPAGAAGAGGGEGGAPAPAPAAAPEPKDPNEVEIGSDGLPLPMFEGELDMGVPISPKMRVLLQAIQHNAQIAKPLKESVFPNAKSAKSANKPLVGAEAKGKYFNVNEAEPGSETSPETQNIEPKQLNNDSEVPEPEPGLESEESEIAIDPSDLGKDTDDSTSDETAVDSGDVQEPEPEPVQLKPLLKSSTVSAVRRKKK